MKCVLLSYGDYKAEKGELRTVAEAFEMGQKVAFAYMGDCLGSLTFAGYGGLIRKIENSRPMTCDLCKKESGSIWRADGGNICMDCYRRYLQTA